jgi:hypothetical protein
LVAGVRRGMGGGGIGKLHGCFSSSLVGSQSVYRQKFLF